MTPIDLDLSINNMPEVNVYSSLGDFEAAEAMGKLVPGQISVVANNNSTNAYTWNGVDGTLYYSDFEYDQDGVKVTDLKNVLSIEKALFEAFKASLPEQAAEWDALLKLNQGDYEITIRQIMEAKKE